MGLSSIEWTENHEVVVFYLPLAISHEFPSKQLPSPPNLEVVTVSVSLVPVVTCCIYAPPNTTVEYHTELNNHLATVTSQPT